MLGYSLEYLERCRARRTAEEILQQPLLWRQVHRDAGSWRAANHSFLAPLLARDDIRIVLAGAGTSAFVGDILAPYLTSRLRRRVDAAATTDLVSGPSAYFGQDVPTLLVSFARSGDSPESLAATTAADQLLSERHHLIITCNPAGALARHHHERVGSRVMLMPGKSHDRGFAMTSSFTCMALAMLLLTDPKEQNSADQLADAGMRALPEIAQRTRVLADSGFKRCVYLGSGALHGLARESALKLLELTAGRVDTYYDTPLGFRHGPKSVLTERTIVIVFLSNDPYTRRYDLDLVDELRTQMHQRVIAVSGRPPEDTDVWHLPGVAELGDAPLSLCYVLVAQTLALHTALRLGIAPDDPFPSGEVNRVVQGVRTYPVVESSAST